jgi:hypothetical protein
MQAAALKTVNPEIQTVVLKTTNLEMPTVLLKTASREIRTALLKTVSLEIQINRQDKICSLDHLQKASLHHCSLYILRHF